MNKENAIKKINGIGKAGNIIAIIMLIISIAGMSLSVVGGTSMLLVPKDLFTFSINANADMNVDISGSGTLSDEEITEAKKAFDNVDFVLNGFDFETGAMSIDESGENVKCEFDGAGYTITPRRVAEVLFTAALSLALVIVAAVFARRLCGAFMVCSSPFEDVIVKRMQQLACALIPWALVSTTAKGLMQSVFSPRLSIMLGIDIGMILVIFIVFALAYIFKYGAILQTESDETL